MVFASLAAHGFPGLLTFSGMIFFTWTSCWRLKRAVRNRQDLSWIGAYADMIQVSFLGFIINGIFVNMEYFDLVYHWVAVVCSLKVVCMRALKPLEVEGAESQMMLLPVAEGT